MMNHFKLLLIAFIIFTVSCKTSHKLDEAQKFIDEYSAKYLSLYKESSLAQWNSNIYIKEGDSTYDVATRIANEKMAVFTGDTAVINKIKDFLNHKDEISPLQIKQLETMLYAAANNPATISDVVKERIKAETEQTSKLFGFQYMLNGKKVSTNNIDEILKDEKDVLKRQKAWDASKEVGKVLKPGLVNLRNLRNKTVQALDYKDYFSYQVSEYGMTTEEMMKLNKDLLKQIWPLYRELHTYMRYNLAQKYNQPVPDYIPAHWIPNRWAQDWSSEIELKGIDLDSVLKTKGAVWITKEAENLYKSIGFGALPNSFYQNSSLYPYAADSAVKKNNHASAWHMDLQNDLRSLMSVEPNTEWWETANHELGHIYYYMTYTTKEVPPLLRAGANRAYHEAIGTLMGLNAMQIPYLQGRGLLPQTANVDKIQSLLKEAMNTVVFMPFSSGTMTHFEKSLYADNLPSEQFNNEWWNLAKKYQGIVPPSTRGDMYCDAATKTHINDDAAQYYDYALSYALLYQMHNHICKNILHQDPTACNYYGNKKIGDFLKQIMKTGSAKDWRKVLKESTGEELNCNAMMEYFKPLLVWLKEQNKGKQYTLANSID